MQDLLLSIRKTRPGSAVAWLLRPRKHRNDIQEHLRRQLPYSPTARQIRWCFWDFFRFCLRYGGDLKTDYFGAQLYRKSDFVRRESMAHGVRHGWRNAIQDETKQNIFLDKRLFYAAFDDHLHRPWMTADQSTTWEAFCAFAGRCSDTVFSKDPTGMGGNGVKRWDLKSEDSRRALLAQCRQSPTLLEGALTQSEPLRSFSEGAVNTLRIITIIDGNGTVHAARSELRMARRGMDVDNYCQGGLVAQVDIATGVVFTPGRDENGKEHLFHPDTGVQIVGFSVPGWERYLAFARELAGRYPTMRYVGWDIMENESGTLCVIEGNKDAGAGGLESGLLYGLRPHYEALLRGDSRSV